MSRLTLIRPEWPSPSNVRACATTRLGGVSQPPFDSLNLGDHVGDLGVDVQRNRAILAQSCAVSPEDIKWLSQVHGNQCIDASCDALAPKADASTTSLPGRVCAVLTADCMPVLLCDRDGTQVAAAHAGWRGLAGGVLANTLARFSDASSLLAWMGPAIGPLHFEVGEDVRAAFCDLSSDNETAFTPTETSGKYLADLPALTRNQLKRLGVAPHQIYDGSACTFSDSRRFYSYRRDGMHTGRQATMIWLANPDEYCPDRD